MQKLLSSVATKLGAYMLPLDKPESPPVVHQSLVSFIFFLVLATLIGALIGGLLAFSIGMLMGIDISSMSAPNENTLPMRTFLRLSNLISHLFTFTVPALILAFILFKKRLWKQLALNKPPTLRLSILGIFWVLISFPFAQLLYWLNQQLPLPGIFLEMEDSATQLLETIMTMNSSGELLLNIIVIGILPAVGEELIFRGLLQRKLESRFSPVWAIWITAFIFSAIHFQFAGFFPRMLLGALLGYLFFWSQNLWVPILGHFFFNASQVTAQYAFGDQLENLDVEGSMPAPWLGGVISLVILLIIARLLYHQRITPQ
ncbi:MAG: CPBP family intramembrane metalloprotease [Saprospiraceae bacterium]|nr:CPBP family intramembrane metalloprotease [Saprospiraceae bacterium]